jgi:starch-binding outer membrane protein, SusD/RagB family
MKQLKYLVSILVIVMLVSCADEGIFNSLDKPPLDQIGVGEYWQTPQDLENYMLQFYPHFSRHGWNGVAEDPAQGSDLSFLVQPNDFLNGTRSTPTSGGGWSWSAIRNINIFFENYDQVDAPFETYRHYIGEAHFFKAYLYFDMLTTFGDVPWYTNSLEIDSEELYKSRDPRNVVADSILWHLDQAIDSLDPISNVDGGTNRISKEAALAFKTRVGLFEGTWQKYHNGTVFAAPEAEPEKYFRVAVEAAEELIHGDYRVGIYSTGATDSDYFDLFGMEDYSNNIEIILWKDHDQSIGESHNALLYVTDRTNGRSGALSQLESHLDRNGNIFNYRNLAREVQGNEFLEHVAEIADPRFSQTFYIPGDLMYDNPNGVRYFNQPFLNQTDQWANLTGFQIKKGNNPYSRGAGADYGGWSETGFIFFRYAEVLLNYAEAKYELDGNVDYDISINLLRDRVGMPGFQVPTGERKLDYGYPISNELYEIRRERSVELGLEGFRNNDLRRWAAHSLFQNQRPLGYSIDESEWAEGEVNIPLADDRLLLDPYQDRIPNGYGFQEDRDYLSPLPVNELTINPNLEQNPGW